MAKKNERVFIRGARLSFPALDEPREAMAGQGDPKYQATFLLEPSTGNRSAIPKRSLRWQVVPA